MKNYKILAIIPARSGSKNIPMKNIQAVNKKPLIAYTIESALNSNKINRVIVSTDSSRIANTSKKYEEVKAQTRYAPILDDPEAFDSDPDGMDFDASLASDTVVALLPSGVFQEKGGLEICLFSLGRLQ